MDRILVIPKVKVGLRYVPALATSKTLL